MNKLDPVILGKGEVLAGGLGVERPNDNQIIFGGTGAGKSMSVLWPTLCHMEQSSFIGTFAKEALVDKAVRFFQTKGYKTVMWNLVRPEEGDSIPDPLQYIETADDLQQFAKTVSLANPSYMKSAKYDPYWKEAAEGLLTGLISYLFLTEEKPCIQKLLELFYSMKIIENGKGIITTLDDDFDAIEEMAPDSIAVRKFSSFRMLPYGTSGCVRDELEKSLQAIFPISIQEKMSVGKNLDFKKFADEKTAIFIITSPVKSVQYSFANLLFSTAITKLVEFAETRDEHCLPRPVRLIFDDFSCGFPVQNFGKSISVFRAMGISCMMLCQSISQLKETYGETESTVIMDNCSCILYLPGGMNKATCSYFSEMLNCPLEEILFMPMGKVVIFRSGKKPKIVERYDTLNDSEYTKLLLLGNRKLGNVVRKIVEAEKNNHARLETLW